MELLCVNLSNYPWNTVRITILRRQEEDLLTAPHRPLPVITCSTDVAG